MLLKHRLALTARLRHSTSECWHSQLTQEEAALSHRFPWAHTCEACWEPAYCILSVYYILSAALSTASSFRIRNSSTGILSLLGARVRNSAHDKGHEEGGSAYAKAGSSLRSPPGNSRASTPQTRVCLLSVLCFHLHL